MKAVLFDAAGVLTAPFSIELVEGALAEGADATVLADVLFPLFSSAGTGDSIGNRLERGEVSLDEFLSSLGRHEADIRLVIDPASATYFGHRWQPNLVMQDFVREVSAAGYLTALVSNNIAEWQATWDRLVPPDLPFDARLFSWQLGTRKPEPQIYEAALDALHVDASDALFLDDFPAMAEGARLVGMTAIDVADAPAAIAQARTLLDLSTGV